MKLQVHHVIWVGVVAVFLALQLPEYFIALGAFAWLLCAAGGQSWKGFLAFAACCALTFPSWGGGWLAEPEGPSQPVVYPDDFNGRFMTAMAAQYEQSR